MEIVDNDKWGIRVHESVVDPGGPGGACPPPQPVKNSHEKDRRQTRWLIFHVSWVPSLKFLDPLL